MTENRKLMKSIILEIEVYVYEGDEDPSFENIKDLVEYNGIYNLNNSYKIRRCNHDNPYIIEEDT